MATFNSTGAGSITLDSVLIDDANIGVAETTNLLALSTASLKVNGALTTANAIRAEDDIYTTGDMHIGGDDLFMGTNTAGHILVADGTNFNSVSLSGDITLSTAGAMDIKANAVQGTDISLASEAAGDIMYFNGTDWVRLSKGSNNGYVLKINTSTNAPEWAADIDTDTTYQAANGLTLNTSTNPDTFELGGALTRDTAITQGSYGFTLNNSGAANSIFNLGSTGDLLIQDNGTTFATFADNGSFTLDSLIFDNTLIAAAGDNGVAVQDNAGNGLFVRDGGNVGIGTLSPAAKLAIVSNSGTTEALIIDSSASSLDSNPAFKVRLPATGGRKGFQITNGSDTYAWASFEWMVGGTDKPGFSLGAGGNSTRDTNLYRENASVLRTNSSFVVDGNIGIADTTPNALLSVGNGDLFTVNSSGNLAGVSARFTGSLTTTSNFAAQSGSFSGTLTASGNADFNGTLDVAAYANFGSSVNIASNAVVGGDLTVTGNDIVMGTNTAGYLLIGDDTNFTPTAVTGDISLAGNGAVTIADNSIDGTDIALGSDARGDIMYYDGTDWVRLAAGTDGEFLQTNGNDGDPVWATPSGTSYQAANGLTLNTTPNPDTFELGGDLNRATTIFAGTQDFSISLSTGNNIFRLGSTGDVIFQNTLGNTFAAFSQNGTDGSFTLDQIILNDNYIGHANDLDLVALNNGSFTINGTLRTTGAISAPTSVDTINGIIINAGTIGSAGAGATWNGAAIADTYVANDLTITSGTINSNNVSGTWTTTGALTIGDNGDNLIISAANWDIDASGNLSLGSGTLSVGNINANSGAFTGTLTVTSNADFNGTLDVANFANFGSSLNVANNITAPTATFSTSLNTALLSLTGTGTINGLDAIDATSESTLESYLDIAGEITGTGLGSVAINDDVIDFSEMKDLMALDATTIIGLGNNNFAFSLSGSGSVGIGTTNPIAPLHLATGQNGFLLTTTDFATPGTGSALKIMMGANTGNTYAAMNVTRTGFISNGDLAIQNSGGNVGIGTTSPDTKLDVFSVDNPQLRLTQEENTTYANFQMTSAGDLVMNVDGATNQFALDNGGNVGIGTTSPSSFKLEVAGSIGPSVNDTYDLGSDSLRFKDLYLGGETIHLGTGAADEGEISYFTGNNVLSIQSDGNLALQPASGFVGIGTTNPTSELSFKPASTIGVSTSDGSDNSFLYVSGAGAASITRGSYVVLSGNEQSNLGSLSLVAGLGDGSTDAGQIKFYTGAGPAQQMVITNTGNVGIGTTNPVSKLHVATAGSSNLVLQRDDATINAGDAYGYLQFYTNDSNLTAPTTAAYIRSTAPASITGTTPYGDLRFGVSNAGAAADAMTIKYDGNVGIGTTDPQLKLDVAGQGRFGDNLSATNVFPILDNAYNLGFDYARYKSIYGVNGLFSNVGIGTTSPQAQLDVNGNMLMSGASGGTISTTGGSLFLDPSSGNINLYDNASSYSLNIYNAGTNKVSLSSDGVSYFNGGNVGIGTTDPQAKLDVEGSVVFGNQLSTHGATGTTYELINQLTTDTTTNNYLTQGSLEINPSVDTPRNYYGGFYNVDSVAFNSSNYTGRLVGFQGQVDHYGTGTLAQARGLAGAVVNQAGGTLTNAYGGYFVVSNASTGTISNAHSLYVTDGANSGTVTRKTGLTITDIDNATNTTDLLIGTSTIPTGNFSFYNANTEASYFAGNVGIGTTNPTNILDVIGGANSYVSLTSASGIAGLQLYNSTQAWQIETGRLGGALDVRDYTNNSIPLTILNAGGSGGFVGIGTTNPTTRLAVGSTDDQNTLRINGVSTGDKAPVLSLFRSGAADWTFADHGSSMMISNNPASYTDAGIASAAKLTIDMSGNIGIGTTGPDRKLDVLDASNPQMRLTQADNSVYADFQMDSNGDLKIGVDGTTNQLVLDNGGNIGIGSAAPIAPLYIEKTLPANGASGLYNQPTFTGTAGFGLFNDVRSSGVLSMGNMDGIYNKLTYSNSGTLNTATVDKNEFYKWYGTDNVTDAYASKSYIYNAEGTITNAYGLDIDIHSDPGATNTNGYGIYINDIDATNDFGIYQAGADDTNYFAGKVGIGTTAPEVKLQLVDTTSVSTFTGDNNQGLRIVGNGSDSNLALLGFSGYTGFERNLAQIGAQYTGSGSYLHFGTSNNYSSGITNTAMTIDYEGNVGIGIANPQNKLDVNGNINLPEGNSIRPGSNYRIDFNPSSSGMVNVAGYYGVRLTDNQDSDYLDITSDNTASILTSSLNKISLSGNVGIGTANPTHQLEMVNGHTNTQFLLHSTGDGGATNTADLMLWASEPGVTYPGVGIANNMYNDTGFPRLNTNRGGSMMRLLDNSIRWGTVSNAGALAEGSMVLDGSGGLTLAGGLSATTVTASSTVAANGGLSQDGQTILNGVDTWLRTYGDTGWFNGTYAGGMYMDNADWIKTYNNKPLYVNGNGTTAATFMNGNVGIGTTSPSNKLEVSSTGNQLITATSTTGWSNIITRGTGDTNSEYSRFTWGRTGTNSQYWMAGYRTNNNLQFYYTPNESNWYLGLTLNPAGGHADIAETIHAVEPTEKGDLLSIANPDGESSVKVTSDQYDFNLIGVVSTRPGMVVGGNEGIVVGSRDHNPTRPSIALSGRVPVKILTPGNPVLLGDAVTSSPLKGYAMQASKTGKVLGSTLEKFSPSDAACSQVSSVSQISWPDDQGENEAKPCYKVPVSSFDTQTQSRLNAEFKLNSNDYVYVGKAMVYVDLTWYDPDIKLANTDGFVLAQTDPQSPDSSFAVINTNGQEVTRVSAMSEAVIGDLKAGSVTATEVATQSLTIAGLPIRDYVTGIVNEVISGAGAMIASIPDVLDVRQVTVEDKLLSPVVEADQVLTDQLAAQQITTSNIKVTNDTGDVLASVDSTGKASFKDLLSNNATVSGTLTAKDASVSGELYAESARIKTLTAEKIKAESIEGLDAKLGKLVAASVSAQFMEMYKLSTPSAAPASTPVASVSATPVPAIPSDWEKSLDNLMQRLNNVEDATRSGSWSAGNQLTLDSQIMTGAVDTDFATVNTFLAVLGSASMVNAEVTNSLTVQTNLTLTGNSLATLSDTLYVQPNGLGKVDILAGAVTVESNGTLRVNGDLYLKGNLYANAVLTNSLSAKTATVSGSLFANLIETKGKDLEVNLGEVKGASDSASQNAKFKVIANNTEVASIDASGSAKLNKLIIANAKEASSSGVVGNPVDPTVASNATAGTATLKAGEKSLTIQNSNITPGSLVYITPASDTGNSVLFISGKVPEFNGQKGSFTVSVNRQARTDIQFNWWIIN